MTIYYAINGKQKSILDVTHIDFTAGEKVIIIYSATAPDPIVKNISELVKITVGHTPKGELEKIGDDQWANIIAMQNVLNIWDSDIQLRANSPDCFAVAMRKLKEEVKKYAGIERVNLERFNTKGKATAVDYRAVEGMIQVLNG